MEIPLTRTQVKMGLLVIGFGFLAEGWAGAAVEFVLVATLIVLGHIMFNSEVDREMGKQVDTRPYTVIVHKRIPEEIPIGYGRIVVYHRVYRAREYDGRAYDTSYRVKEKWEDREWAVEEVVRKPVEEIEYPSVLNDARYIAIDQ